MIAELDIIVRSTEIDVNGHVNNAKYLEYLEWGREEWYEKAGLHYDRFTEMGVQTVTVNVNINYRKECVQGDRLKIVTRPESMGRSSFILQQEIVHTEKGVVADARVTSVTMGIDTRKGVAVPEPLAWLFLS
jgi:thioesterase-3